MQEAVNPTATPPEVPPKATKDVQPLKTYSQKANVVQTSGKPQGDAAREGGESLPADGTADGPALALVGQRPEAGPGTADDHDTPQPGESLAEFLTRRGAVVPAFPPPATTDPFLLRPDGSRKSQEELAVDLAAALEKQP
jgi:hypothetical protein